MPFAQTYAGLRVLDLSENIAGPLACLILADLGADVIKVERPGVGEATRSLPPRWEGPPGSPESGEATVFLGFNRNKRSLAIDIRRPEARDAVLAIGRRADVVVESFRPGVATRLGLDFDAFAAGNDRLVHCAVSAFGTGPIGHDRAGYDALIQAYSGILEATGEPDGGPCRAAPSVIDMTTGMWAALSIQAALHRRETEPAAQRLEATLVDTGLFLMSHQIMGYLGTGSFPGRLGAAAPSAAPYNVWPTADRPIMIATSTDRTYATLCEVIGRPDLATDPRFATMPDRLTRRAELDALIGEQLRGRGADAWLDALWAAGVPAGPVHDLAAALDDPLTKERALLAPAEAGRIPGLQQLHLPMDNAREARLRQPPAVGEHTHQVLTEAGFTPAEIARITQEGTR